MALKKYLPIILILLILLLATALRFYNLGGQSLWYDEGVAFGHSQRSLAEMIPRLQNNVHVPAYFGSLALYEDLVGYTEFALRSYSVLWSIIGIAGVYALGKRLFHPIAGLSSALLVALNGFSIYYAQETRMYAMLATVAVLSMLAFVKWAKLALQPYPDEATHKPSMTVRLWQWGFAFALINVLGEYTHVSYALVMLVQGLMAIFLLINLLSRAVGGSIPYNVFLRALLIYTVVNIVSLLLFAPWILTAVSQISSQPNISDNMPLGEIIRIIQGWFAFGISFEEGIGGMSVVMYFFLLFGLLNNTDNRKVAWWTLLLPIVWVLVSVGAYLYLELYARYLRFLLPAQLGFALWMGRGAWVLWEIIPRTTENRSGWQKQATLMLPKITAIVAILAFAWQQFTLLPALYTGEDYVRDDYRTMVATIMDEAGEGDAIILSAPGIQEIFGYYYDDIVPIYTLPASDNIADDTQAIIDEHERIYVVLYGQAEQDPNQLVEATLNQNAFPITGEWVGDVRFERYASPASFDTAETVNIQFGDSIILETIALSERSIRPNNALQIQLTWQTDTVLETRYKVFLQLLNSEGVLVAQRDSEPSGNQAPTTAWEVGDTITDNHALAIPNLEAGDYTLILGLYDLNNPQERLRFNDADFWELATITIE
ncbi:MAG: hypothetical protein Phog2KO_43450 [Phototrophicaceae bacterium]